MTDEAYVGDSLIIAAAGLARTAHAGQVRRWSGAPYIRHPARVAGRTTLLPWANPVLVAVAWLHDVAEDTDVGLEDIRARLRSDAVVDGVAWLTDQFTKELHPSLNRRERKKRELDRLSQAPIHLRAVKLLDRIDNLGEQDPTDDFARTYVVESEALGLRLGSDLPDLLGELMGEVARLRSLAGGGR